MAMIPQMSLFNTSPQVSGFKLDYMEVWNWGTFDKEIYRLTPQGNNSLLTGANASGKSSSSVAPFFNLFLNFSIF